MDSSFRLLPQQASSLAGHVDALYFYLLAAASCTALLIAVLIVYFSIKYRKGSAADRTPIVPAYRIAVETVYIGAPLLVFASMFYWGAILYFDAAIAPDDAIEIQVVAKQWMWKLQHPSGRREINELHVPLGRAVRLKMISEDVIHSFFVPAFRIKQDVLPGRYLSAWFKPAALGQYRLLCAEYCGTNHSQMGGRVIVLEPRQYEAWLAGGSVVEPAAVTGERLFAELHCNSCHEGASPRGPALAGLWNSNVVLASGQSVVADDDYLRESILRPAAKIVAGFQPLMPSFEGQLNEEELLLLISYLHSLNIQSRIAP